MRRLHFETVGPVCPLCRVARSVDAPLKLERVERDARQPRRRVQDEDERGGRRAEIGHHRMPIRSIPRVDVVEIVEDGRLARELGEDAHLHAIAQDGPQVQAAIARRTREVVDEDAVVGYMNAEHTRALRDYCRFFHGRETARTIMVGVDCDGFDLRADDDSPHAALRVDFDHPVITATGARAQLLALAKKARAA